MPLPFINGSRKRPDELLSIDLGSRMTKAVQLEHKGNRFVMSRYVLLDAPTYERSLSAQVLGEHVKEVCAKLGTKTRAVSLAVGVNEAIVRHADLPQMPVGDMRQVLRNNAKIYLQQDLPGHVFDCHIMPTRAVANATEKPKLGPNAPKHRVLVAGAKKQLVDEIQAAIKATGLIPQHVMPGLLGPVNAFELAEPEIFSLGVVALVDIGFKNTSICVLQDGELILSRVVGIGGDRLTQGLAESLGVSYGEAEGIKVGLPTEVQGNLEALVVPLGRELRASMDFFEHQQDRAVSHVYISGGSARSELIVQILRGELLVECKLWNPLSFLQLELPQDQASEVELVAPQLAVAVGAGLSAL